MKFWPAMFACIGSMFLSCAAYADAPMTQQQGEAILNELRAIHQLLARQAAPAAPGNAAPARTLSVKAPATHVMGKANAPVTLVAFTDFQCPYCARFEASTFPELKKKYIDTGKMRYVLRDVPLDFHPLAINAAQSVRCAGDQNKYWEMKDLVFKNQARIDTVALASYAQDLGLDASQYQQCMTANKYLADINADRQYAHSLGISGTPSFVIGRQVNGVVQGRLIVGAQGLSVFEHAIEDMLAKP
ncbi:MAG: DsbA family protein [Burkholderiaceae bacterium]|nr:DsbA family protein [Burkholderiaceae bacterium]